MYPKHEAFPKIPRLNRDIVITEKIDGTNALVYVNLNEDWVIAGSKNRWLTLEQDNHGFARWVLEHRESLKGLGDGWHRGEWWGQGIQRGYGLKEKRFSLFNVAKWEDPEVRPWCCDVVPVLYEGPWVTEFSDGHAFAPELALVALKRFGSYAVPGFFNPEGIVVYHKAGNVLFKATLENDEGHKGDTHGR